MSVRIAVVQMDVALGQVERNLAALLERTRAARKQSAQLIIFPECVLTGYCFDSVDEVLPHAQSIPGSATRAIQAELQSLGGAVIYGTAEPTGAGGVCNSAVLVTGAGVQAVYRKIHLPFLGLDRFSQPGREPFAVQRIRGEAINATEADEVRVGMAICYDSAFPESVRTLALLGADLVTLPTNFALGADGMVEHVQRTRALENKVYFACSNRVGDERGQRFIGGSQIVDPLGKVLALAGREEETILYSDIDPALARDKRVIRPPGAVALDRFADRRPEMYGMLTVPVRAEGQA